ncbi:MAG: hypothetical protein EP321_15530 [Sphingomonadales bacterium]|nr:MAG: hypothetical protein EP345_08360 [Sphingomonadales bacterium]TNF01892.1 MAG: hypothetical protein EP321_15530 [Sphingomonadales bacterium]
MARTGFYSNERTFWHSTGMQILFMPVGGWVRPTGSSIGAETPEVVPPFWLFGVSTYGPEMGLRITEGLGLVVVT